MTIIKIQHISSGLRSELIVLVATDIKLEDIQYNTTVHVVTDVLMRGCV